MASDKIMHRGLQQALYKYLPENWVDFTQSGGSVTYAVHVDNWNSVQLMGINNKRLLRVINQQINEYKTQNGEGSVVGFPSVINEEFVDVLTPKVSDNIAAIQTSVKPWVFVCNKCGNVRQYYSYDEFKRKEFDRCKCGEHLTQLRMIRVCKCGYADGVFVPKCKTPGHGTTYMKRKGSGLDFVCQKCGQRASLPHYCPECKQEIKILSSIMRTSRKTKRLLRCALFLFSLLLSFPYHTSILNPLLRRLKRQERKPCDNHRLQPRQSRCVPKVEVDIRFLIRQQAVQQQLIAVTTVITNVQIRPEVGQLTTQRRDKHIQ